MRNIVAVLSMFLCFTLCITGGAQNAQTGLPQSGAHPVDSDTVDQERRMEKSRNKQRQQDLKRDTDKLLELATELKQYVDRTNESMMSIEVINKAEQIERLAKSVKNKMKGP